MMVYRFGRMKTNLLRKVVQAFLLAAGLILYMYKANSEETKDNDPGRILFDFNSPENNDRWITVNDNVMGGRSKGGFSFRKKRLVFAGSTNTNGGGFSSIRTKPVDMKLGNADGVIIRYKADDRTYKFDVRMERSSVAHRADFNKNNDTRGWQETVILFKDLTASWRGMRLSGERFALDQDRIQSMGFMIYDKKDGPFKLQVDWIKAYTKSPRS